MRRADAVLLAMVVLLAGCAVPGGGLFSTQEAAPLFRDPALSVEGAARAITPGLSDKREVEERLGPAERLAFGSGYEVWVYRAREKREGEDGAELVILFDPRGTLSKLRVRPPDPAAAGAGGR